MPSRVVPRPPSGARGAPSAPVRGWGYAESHRSLRTAPGCSGPLPASIPITSSRFGHEIASSRCTSGAEVLPADPLIRRGHHHASRRSARATCLDVGRSSSMLCGHACTSNSSIPATPVDLPGQRATWHSAGSHVQPNPTGHTRGTGNSYHSFCHCLGGPQPAGRASCPMA